MDEDTTGTTTSIISGLPLEPLTIDTITTLEKHDGIEACFPVYQFVDEPDAVIAILLKTKSIAAFAVYNPLETRWEKTFQTDIFESAYSDDALEAQNKLAEQDNTVFEFYNEDSVELVVPEESQSFDPIDDTFTDLLTVLPNAPIDRETLVEFNREPEVIQVVPHVYLRDSEEILLFTVTIEELSNSNEVYGIAVFDEDNDEWNPFFSMDAVRLQDENDTQFEDEFTEAYDSVIDSYDQNDLASLNTQQEYDEWWIPSTRET